MPARRKRRSIAQLAKRLPGRRVIEVVDLPKRERHAQQQVRSLPGFAPMGLDGGWLEVAGKTRPRGNPRPRPWTDHRMRVPADSPNAIQAAKAQRAEKLLDRMTNLVTAGVRAERVIADSGARMHRAAQDDDDEGYFSAKQSKVRAEEQRDRIADAASRVERAIAAIDRRYRNPTSRARLLARLDKLHDAVARGVSRRSGKPPSKRQIAIEKAYDRTLRAFEYSKRSNPMARRKKKNPWLLRGPGGRFSKTGTPAWSRKRKPRRKSKARAAFKGPRRLGRMPPGLRKYWAKRLGRASARRPTAKERAYRKRARSRYRSHKAYLDRTRTFDAITGSFRVSKKPRKRTRKSGGGGGVTVLWSQMLQKPPYGARPGHGSRKPKQMTLPGMRARRRKNPRRARGRRPMPAALKRYWAARRRRRNPKALIVNPSRKRRSSMARRRRRFHGRRRRNPGGVVGTVINTVKQSIPALMTGGVIGALDTKVLAGKPPIVGVLAKVGIGIGAALALRGKPNLARSVADGAFATLGYQAGIKLLGGVKGGSIEDSAKEMSAIVAEDEQAMGVLTSELQGMGVLQVEGAAEDAAALFEGTEPLEFEGGDEGWG